MDSGSWTCRPWTLNRNRSGPVQWQDSTIIKQTPASFHVFLNSGCWNVKRRSVSAVDVGSTIFHPLPGLWLRAASVQHHRAPHATRPHTNTPAAPRSPSTGNAGGGSNQLWPIFAPFSNALFGSRLPSVQRLHEWLASNNFKDHAAKTPQIHCPGQCCLQSHWSRHQIPQLGWSVKGRHIFCEAWLGCGYWACNCCPFSLRCRRFGWTVDRGLWTWKARCRL